MHEMGKLKLTKKRQNQQKNALSLSRAFNFTFNKKNILPNILL